MGTKSFAELRKQMSPERRAENTRQAQLALLRLKLSEQIHQGLCEGQRKPSWEAGSERFA